MTARRPASATKKQHQARRDAALSRPELRYPSTPRSFPQGPFSPAVKVRDPELERMVAEALASGRHNASRETLWQRRGRR
jgi:hypothetical protein